MSFLKEQQWRTEFATAPVREGTLAESVSGPAQVKPAAGGEVGPRPPHWTRRSRPPPGPTSAWTWGRAAPCSG